MTQLIPGDGLSGSDSVLIPLLFDLAAKGTVVLLVGAGIAWALGRASASVRHHVWLLAVLGLIGLPALTLVLPRWRVAVLPEAGDVAAAPDAGAHHSGYSTRSGDATRATTLRIGADSPTTEPLRAATSIPLAATSDSDSPADAASAPESLPEEGLSSARVLTLAAVATWLAGAVLCLLPYVAGTARLRRTCRGATLAPATLEDEARKSREQLGLSEPVRLLLSPRVAVPMTWGLLRSTILLPPEFHRWTPTRRRSVLIHELAHVRRRDCLTRLIARIGVALHWFNPLAWVAEARLRVESERACDDFVIRTGAPADDYADCLVEIARSLTAAGRAPTAAIAMARPSRLEGRLRAILDLRLQRAPLGRRARCTALILAFLAVAPLAALHLTAREASQAAPNVGDVIVVAADGTGEYSSVQKAIDAAPEGAIIRIGPGLYDERLVIRKRLTLEGAGWSETVLASEHEVGNPMELRERMGEIQRRMRSARTDAERQAIRAEVLEEHGRRAATLRVDGAHGVVLRDLKITLRGKGSERHIPLGAIVNLVRADAQLTRCVFAGSPAHGIHISGGSDVDVRECLVAGVWGSGILVDQGVPSGRVRIVESDIRNCRHRGVHVRPGGQSNLIERCRVSGSAWHGIRYDHSAPVITGNLIFDNERCAIYASGQTAATVERNLFHGNGITCWIENRDTIRGNTFVAMHGDTFAGDSQGVCILGAAKPTIVKNIFADLETGVYLGNTSGSSSDGKAHLEGNLFWKTGSKLLWRRPDGDAAEPEVLPVDLEKGNLEGDPGFVGAGALDFSLAPDSPLRREGIGAADHPSFESPWPPQPEEGTVTADEDDRERKHAEDSLRVEAQTIARPWIDDALQIRDRATRDAAVARIRAALASEDPAENLAGLNAFLATLEANYDKASFREPILPLVHSTDGETQRSAFYALYNCGKNPDDLELIYDALEESPSQPLRRSASHLISMYTEGNITGRAGDVVLDLLESEQRDDVREVLRGLWGARVTPAIERRLVELAGRGSELRHDSIYFGLSTLRNKSREVLQALFEATEDSDPNNSGRALWGLQHGVPEENHTLVADFVVDLIDARVSPRTRSECIDLLARYGSRSHLEPLARLVENNLLGEELRQKASQAAESIRARLGEE